MTGNLEETAPWEREEPAPRSEARKAWLTVLVGHESGRVIPLEPGRTTLGRGAEADVVIAGEQVSRIHAELEVDPFGEATIRDCGSKNGTMLGSRPITDVPRELRDGARIQVGGAAVLRFSFRDHLEEHFEARLYESATRDVLTGAYNRRHFTERLEQHFALARRHGRPLALLLLDLDDFKRINDLHGHAAGDLVLREVVTAIDEDLRSGELLGRLGGDELAVLLASASLEEGLMVAERLRRRIERVDCYSGTHHLRPTASFGVASTSRGRMESTERLFVEADENLYRAKRAGKNRVCGSCLGC